MTVHRLDIDLPAGYRHQDALAFHGRDAAGVAERVDGASIRKGVLLEGVPVQLGIVLDADRARCSIDAAVASVLPRARAALVDMLGLRIDPAPFEHAVRDDPLFGPVTRRTPGLRVIQSATVFEALTWAIIGQQINLSFAIALRRSFIQQAGRVHPGGLWCYPEASDVARLDPGQLTSRKFSRAKADTLLRLARLVADGALSLEREDDPAATGARLLAVKGIGPWTVNYTLLRGYGAPDCSLHGDVAVRSAIGRLLGADARPDMAQAEAFLAAYRPHRTMAAAYLWASLNQPAGQEDS
jgi:DNA-3-methyladenine glycosylase II